MRILFIITRAEPLGGAQIHVRDVALALKAHDHDIHVIFGNDGQIARQLAEAGVSVHFMKHLYRPIRPVSDVRAFLEFKRIVRKLKPDLVSAHSSKAGCIARLVGRSTGTPTLYTAHGLVFSEGIPRFRRLIYLWAEKMIGRISDQIIAVCEHDRNMAITERVVQPERILVIHNAMPDVGCKAIAEPATDPPTIVMVARFMPQKDHKSVLMALSELKHLRWMLQFVGDGPLEESARRLVKDLDLENRVEFLGKRLDVDRILARAQIFLLVTKWEGLSRSTIEALRAGLPCIVSNVGGMSELISDSIEGYLVPQNDRRILTQRLQNLIEDPDLRVRFGIAARQRYERDFQFGIMFEKTMKVYDKLIQRNSIRA